MIQLLEGGTYLVNGTELVEPAKAAAQELPAPEEAAKQSALYRKKADQYNQTASKAEQIALCQFIRDGHLAAQTRKLKRLYSVKLKALRSAVREVFGKDSQIQTGAAGTSLALTLSTTLTWQELQKKAQTNGLRLQLLRETPGKITLILSCSSMPVADFVPACKLLKDISQIQN